jgi:hypothetical protein
MPGEMPLPAGRTMNDDPSTTFTSTNDSATYLNKLGNLNIAITVVVGKLP